MGRVGSAVGDGSDGSNLLVPKQPNPLHFMSGLLVGFMLCIALLLIGWFVQRYVNRRRFLNALQQQGVLGRHQQMFEYETMNVMLSYHIVYYYKSIIIIQL